MNSRISPRRIGGWSARHPWQPLAIWVGFVAACVVLIDATVIRSVLLPPP